MGINMAVYQTREDRLVNILSWFNQIFLAYLLLNIVFAVSFEGSHSGLGLQDSDFDSNPLLSRTENHSTFATFFIVLGMFILVWVSVSEFFRSRSTLRLLMIEDSSLRQLNQMMP